MNTSETLTVINRIASDSIEQFKTFSNSEWESPSRCHMWATKDVVSHLVAIFGFNLNSIAMTLSKNSLPGEGMPNPGTFNSKDMASAVASRAIQLSETSLKNKITLVETLSTIKHDFMTQCDSIGPEEWDLDSYHPVNILSPRLILLIILLEVTLHSWDVFSALKNDYQVDQEASILLINLWKNSKANSWFIDINETNSNETPKIIDIDLGLSTKLRITALKGNLNIFEKLTSMNDAPTTIKTNPSDFALLITARINLFDLIDQKKVTITGNKPELLMFHKWFKGT